MLNNRKIYDQHDAAFKAVEAFAVLKNGEHVANVKFKHGAAVTAYVHFLGSEMTRGSAGGGGYDKRTAAVSAGAAKIRGGDGVNSRGIGEENACSFVAALAPDNGIGWERLLESVGFVVLRVI